GLHRKIGSNPLLLLANKIDLFPESTKWGRCREWVQRFCKEMGIRPVDVILMSVEKGENLDRAVAAMEHYRRGRSVYVVGTTNVGKSSLINRLLQDYGEGEGIVTTSPFPGTTLDTIQIPLDDGQKIIDTPGIVRKDRLSEWVPARQLRTLIPKKRMKP